MPSRNTSEKFPRVGVSAFLAFVSWIVGLSGVVFTAVPTQQSMPPALSAGVGRSTPRTITVGKSGAYDYSTIQAAIDAATTGDTIIVYPATYVENINFSGKNIILRSTNPTSATVVAATIIDSDASGPVVRFSGSETDRCVLSGFTIRNGRADSLYYSHGGGVLGGKRGPGSNATIENSIIVNNRARCGGGLAFCNGTIRNNVITSNTAEARSPLGGGLYSCDGPVRNNLITRNRSGWLGGGLADCKGYIQGNTITHNSREGLWNCTGEIANCIVWGNSLGQVLNSTSPTYSCIQGWTGGGVGNISADPLFTTGPLGPYYLSQTAAGQSAQSPCVDAGSSTALQVGLADRTTRTDGVRDTGIVDMGYHYPTTPPRPFSLAWSTYLGGSGSDGVARVVTDREGNIFVCGNTDSSDFPSATMNSSPRTSLDVFIVKLDASGALLWTRFLGGSGNDLGLGLAVDPDGNLLVTGTTWSQDFPTSAAYDPTYNGGDVQYGDAFVTKLGPDGRLIWSTYLGGHAGDYGWDIEADGLGNVYVTGSTASGDFPTTKTQGRVYAGGMDSFVAKFNHCGRLLWSRYLGGSGEDLGYGLAVDVAANVYAAGRTRSSDFPTTAGFQMSYRGGASDGYISKFNTNGHLLWSTYLGGHMNDVVADVVCDHSGHIYVTGETGSSDFPARAAWDTTPNGGADGYVSELSSTGSLIRSTFLGGSGDDAVSALTLDAAGRIYVIGLTKSADFPTTGGGDATYNGGYYDVFVAAFDGLSRLAYSTYLGGSGRDESRRIAADALGNVYAVGATQSTDFPTTRAWQPVYGGGAWDGFVTKFGGVPATTQPLIAMTPARFDLSVTEGTRPATTTLWVWNRGGGTLGYQIRAPNVIPLVFPPLNFAMQVTPSQGQSSGQRNPHHVSFFEVEHLLPGTYTQNIVISGNASNSPTTVPVRITVNPRPPSLVVSPTRFDVAVTAGQQSTTRTLQVRNGGGGTLAYTVATSPSWLISVQPPSGTATGVANNHVVTFITGGLPPGTYHGRLTVAATMPSLAVFVPAVVTVNAPLLPNLTVSHVDVAPKAPVQVHPGDRIALSAFLENAGTRDAGPFWTEVWGSKTGGLTLDRLLVPSLRLANGLRAGGSYSWVANAPLASIPDGRYTVVYAVDRLGQVAESNERDNRAVVRGKTILVVRPQTQIDLAVEGFGMSPNPAQSGGQVRFSGRVVNRGTQASGPFWIEFWGSRDWPYPSLSFSLCASMLVQNLAPGARVDLSTISRRLYNVPSGVFMVGCVADRRDSVNETNKTNNYQFVDGQVFNHSTLITRPPDEGAAAGRDIAIRSADFSPAAPSHLASGATVTLTVELANLGSLNTGPFWLEYWGSLDGGLTLKNLLTDSDRITNIAPGQTVRLSGRKALGRMADGLYTVVVVADRPNRVAETNEANNRRAIAGKRLLVIRPQTGANLVVEQFRFYLPFWPRIEPYGTVRNAGTANSGSFWVEFWASPGDADYPSAVWPVCPAMRVADLPPGGSVNLTHYRPNAYGSLPAGLSTILCIVDRTDQAVETDETDNYQMVRRVVIPPH